MATRRQFLSLLAATPIAAPVAAKAGAMEIANGGFMSGEVQLVLGVAGERCQSFPLSPAQSRAFEPVLTARPSGNQVLSALLRAEMPWEVPNRLCGASINEDGEAV